MTYIGKLGVELLAATMLFVQAGAAADKATAKQSPRAEPSVTDASAAVLPAVITAEDVKALREAVEAQRLQIEALQQQMALRDLAWQQTQQQLADAKASISRVNVAGGDEASVPKELLDLRSDKLGVQLASLQTAVAGNVQNSLDEQKRVSSLESTLGRFRWNGDVRLRGESFFQQGVADRNRARVRVRFGFDRKVTEDFTAGVALASGILTDSLSTNATLTDFFQKKTIGIDRAFITYHPRVHAWFSATGGKWAYSWNRTSDTFDPDLNPEGFNEKFSFDLPSAKVFKNVTAQAIQLLFNEVGSGVDSFAVGGSASTRAELLGGRLVLTPSYTVLNFRNADSILNASATQVGATTTGSTGTAPIPSLPIPGSGPGCQLGNGLPNKVAPCGFGPQGITNATFTTTDSTGNVTQHFLSKFLYSDFILSGQYRYSDAPWAAKLPLNFTFEYLDNLGAAESVPTVDAAGKATLVLKPRQGTAYYFEASLGQNRNKGDLQFGYAYNHQEQDSAIASFTESEQRAPTNINQNRFFGVWKVASNVSAEATFWYGHTIDSTLVNAALAKGTKPGGNDPYLKRVQFDLVYAF